MKTSRRSTVRDGLLRHNVAAEIASCPLALSHSPDANPTLSFTGALLLARWDVWRGTRQDSYPASSRIQSDLKSD
jgi:hypothetical protein